MQLDLRTLFIVLVTLYACLGFVCLLLPYRMPGSQAVTQWGYGLLALAAGMAGLALRGVIPDLISVILANASILAAFLFVLSSVRQGRGPAPSGFGWSVVAVSVLLLAYFTYMQPDTRIRIVIASVAMALLVVRPVVALIAGVPGVSRRARIFTAACLAGVGFVMLLRAVLTMIDPLTAILNRRAFMLEYEREVSRCRREQTGLALAIFDLDHFKDVNDNYGHLVGDRVLRQVADTLRASLRGHDVLGRYGGEEFALLMPGADTAAAMAGTERARLAVGERPVEAGRLSIPVTVSAGVAVYGPNGSDWESLLRSADAALYEAKRGGRNRVVAAHGPPATLTQSTVPLPAG